MIGDERRGIMINTDELRGEIAKKGTSQRKLAKAIGVTDTTFYKKMKKGVFGSDEIEKIVNELEIDKARAIEIFFAV